MDEIEARQILIEAEERRVKRAAYQREYYKKNREKVKASVRKWQQRKRDEEAAAHQAWLAKGHKAGCDPLTGDCVTGCTCDACYEQFRKN